MVRMILLAFLQQELQSRLILSTMQQVYNHTSEEEEEAYLIFDQFEKERKTQTRILFEDAVINLPLQVCSCEKTWYEINDGLI